MAIAPCSVCGCLPVLAYSVEDKEFEVYCSHLYSQAQCDVRAAGSNAKEAIAVWNSYTVPPPTSVTSASLQLSLPFTP